MGVKGASQVVLVDLSLVEGPAVVFVLADVKPLFAGFAWRSTFIQFRANADVHPVAGEPSRLRGALANAGDERRHSAAL
jgi:hypothetical protein